MKACINCKHLGKVCTGDLCGQGCTNPLSLYFNRIVAATLGCTKFESK